MQMDINTFVALFEDKEKFVQYFSTQKMEIFQLGHSAYPLARMQDRVLMDSAKVEIPCSCGITHVLYEKQLWAIHEQKLWIAHCSYHEIARSDDGS